MEQSGRKATSGGGGIEGAASVRQNGREALTESANGLPAPNSTPEGVIDDI